MMMVCYQSMKFISNDILHSCFTVILVGFEETFTSVNETAGSFELCVAIFTDTSLLPANFQFSLNLITIPGIAGICDTSYTILISAPHKSYFLYF